MKSCFKVWGATLQFFCSGSRNSSCTSSTLSSYMQTRSQAVTRIAVSWPYCLTGDYL